MVGLLVRQLGLVVYCLRCSTIMRSCTGLPISQQAETDKRMEQLKSKSTQPYCPDQMPLPVLCTLEQKCNKSLRFTRPAAPDSVFHHQVQMVTRNSSALSENRQMKPDMKACVAFGLASYLAKRLSY